jgi:hypothetical protein
MILAVPFSWIFVHTVSGEEYSSGGGGAAAVAAGDSNNVRVQYKVKSQNYWNRRAPLVMRNLLFQTDYHILELFCFVTGR